MSAKTDLNVCMGSACHQYGVYQVLPELQRLLGDYGLEDKVELKGAFCLGTCTEGVVLMFKGKQFSGIRPSNLEQRFKDEILRVLRANTSG